MAFWEQALDSLSGEEWEALCDGCAKCCVLKLEDEDTLNVHYTSIGCRLLDDSSCTCTNYALRQMLVPGCVKVTKDNIGDIAEWMPKSCAYRLRHEGKPLPDWHHLITGDRNSVHRAGASVQNQTVSETEIDEDNYEDYIINEA